MHLHFHYAKTLEAYDYDYSSDLAIRAISLVHYWCTYAFQVANCNGFCFNASPLGLKPDGSLCLSMILYDSRTETYVNDDTTICLTQDVNIQILYSLFSLMHAVQHIFIITMTCSPSHVHAF